VEALASAPPTVPPIVMVTTEKNSFSGHHAKEQSPA
jgi:hypothetical protein